MTSEPPKGLPWARQQAVLKVWAPPSAKPLEPRWALLSARQPAARPALVLEGLVLASASLSDSQDATWARRAPHALALPSEFLLAVRFLAKMSPAVGPRAERQPEELLLEPVSAGPVRPSGSRLAVLFAPAAQEKLPRAPHKPATRPQQLLRKRAEQVEDDS